MSFEIVKIPCVHCCDPCDYGVCDACDGVKNVSIDYKAKAIELAIAHSRTAGDRHLLTIENRRLRTQAETSAQHVKWLEALIILAVENKDLSLLTYFVKTITPQ